MGHCKRSIVTAVGVNKAGQTGFATNYNLTEEGCTGKEGVCGCAHAEEQLLTMLENPEIIFVSHSPCLDCAKKIVNSGAKIVVYSKPYRLSEGLQHLLDNGVQVYRSHASYFNLECYNF